MNTDGEKSGLHSYRPLVNVGISLSADEFDKLPTAPWFDVQGRVIPNHPDLPEHMQNLEPEVPNLVRRVFRQKQRAN